VLARVKTLVWNGPFGAFEMEPFDTGTIEAAEAAAELTTAGALSRWPAAATRGGAQRRRRCRAVYLRIHSRRRAFLDGWRARHCLGYRY